jgi:WD40 repeat protein
MSRVCSFSFGLAALLASLALVHGEEAKTPRQDLYGDPLPPGAVARLGTLRLRHADVVAMTFSKDGKRLISCNRDGEVRVWDTATGKLVRRTLLASKARELTKFGYVYMDFSLTPDGTTALASDGRTMYVYDTLTGRERGRLSNTQVSPDTPAAQMLAFSPDGKKIVMNWWDKEGNGFTQLWDIIEFKKYLSLDGPPRTVLTAVAFTPDGKQLAAAGGKDREELFVWDAVTGKLKQRKKHGAALGSLVFAPDGATLAAGRYGIGEAVLFDAATLKEKAALPARANVKVDRFTSVNMTGFSPDGRLLVGACYIDGDNPPGQKGFLIWDLSGPKAPRWLPTSSFIHAPALAPDGKTLACCISHIVYGDGGGNGIDLWDVASGRRLHQWPCHNTSVDKLAVSSDGKTLVSSDSSRPALRLWDTATGKPLRSLAGWDEFGSAYLLFSADGQRLASVSRKGKLQMWEAATGKELCRFAIDSPGEGVYPAYRVAFLGDGKRLATAAMMRSTRISIWDAATGERLLQRPLSAVQPTPSQGFVEFAPDGESVTVWRSDSRTAWLGDRLTIEDISTRSLLATLPKGVGHPLAFSADGRLLAVFLQPRTEHMGAWMEPKPILETYDVKGLSLIETASGQEVVRLDIRRFDRVAITSDGGALVVTDKQKLSVWDAATGEQLHQMAWPECIRDGHGYAKISSLAVLPGGRVATGTTEGEILVWDLAPSTWPIRQTARERSRDRFDALWSDLARDARTAYRAVSSLAASPAWSVPLLDAHLHPVALGSKRIEKLIADLDDDRYEVREAASRELPQLRCAVEPSLRRVLADKPSLEMRRRLENILTEPKHPTAENLRTQRAIAVLERIGTPEARRILEKLSKGAAAPETRAAQAALQRLNHRDASAIGRSPP